MLLSAADFFCSMPNYPNAYYHYNVLNIFILNLNIDDDCAIMAATVYALNFINITRMDILHILSYACDIRSLLAKQTNERMS